MPPSAPALPDCDLATLLRARLSPRDAHLLQREGGRACARYLREGGRLAGIRWEESRIRNGHLALLPPPAGPRTLYPDRAALEADLADLRERGRPAAPGPRDALRFLLALAGALAREDPAWNTWVRDLLYRHRSHSRERVRLRYDHFHAESAPDRDLDLNGLWVPDPRLRPEDLLRAISHLHPSARPPRRPRRAQVSIGRLLGHDVVVKRFSPNPRLWKRRWEVSRARRAWTGACTLQELGIPCTYPLGWLERRENGRLMEAYFISRRLPVRDNARVWLRRIWPGLSPSERANLRHRLRREVRQLHHYGLSHRDLKLSNLMVRERPERPPVFYWIDLEDLRPDGPSRRTFLRNLYQLNGSLPRDIKREERLAFARGFRDEFPLADHPGVHAYVEYVTRRRLRRELRRLRGP